MQEKLIYCKKYKINVNTTVDCAICNYYARITTVDKDYFDCFYDFLNKIEGEQ